jgi:hypothetical protein
MTAAKPSSPRSSPRLRPPLACVTKSRTLRNVDRHVAPAEQPALFQAEGRQTRRRCGQPTKWTFRAELALYVHAATCGQDDVVVHSTPKWMRSSPRSIASRRRAQTLGGLVHDCRIAGDIETDEGRLGDQAVAIIPIEIIANV